MKNLKLTSAKVLDTDFTELQFGDVRVTVRVCKLWRHEVCYVEIYTPSHAFTLKLNDPTSISGKKNYGWVSKRCSPGVNIFSQVGEILHPYKTLRGFGITGYIKAIVVLNRAKNPKMYKADYNDALCKRNKVHYFIFK